MGNLNSLKEIFNLSYIQSELRELGLYTGKIDGLFGKGCYDSLDVISKTLNCNALITRTNSWNASVIFTNLQKFLTVCGYSTQGIDGKWGKNSQSAFELFIDNYRHKANVNHYWYAWSGNNAVFDEGIVKLRKWLIEENKKPDIHVDYILTLFALITKKRFNPSMVSTNGSVGLIGFTEVSAKSVGTTLEALTNMTFSEQIDYVIKYYNFSIKSIETLDDYYSALMSPSLSVRLTPPDVSNTLSNLLWEGLDPINRDVIECHVEQVPVTKLPEVVNPNISKPVPTPGKSGFVFGKASEQRLIGVKPILVKIVRRALELSEVDFGVREGLRTIEQQREYVKKGVSQTMNSKHLTGDAVDLYPTYLPPDWGRNYKVFLPVMIAVHKASQEYDVKMRFGVNWKGDPTLSIETKFVDAPHCELAS